ncbi:hypothetical protein B0T19DRAFT_396781 [Cercophora scortea]|uniref:RRM domain-containing protein n=1 Tax=Cercophora scortea TaxID=314031 RepID=A0AAE0J566_9PEZI|nr:hypothetical protein B0T19DRAFT_396781 [Cercophora scortea]
MDRSLDRSLDEILSERKQAGGRGGPRANRGGNGRDRRERQDYPRDGVRKSFRDRDDTPRNIDSEWVHDRFEENANHRSAPRRRNSPDPSSDYRGGGSKIRVDNVHYELTQEDLEGLFSKIGPLVRLDVKYDRAGRSEGTAFVTYESAQDATRAIREYDGANAAGQPIRLTLMPTGPRRNPFDTAVLPGRPLSERITVPGGRSRSLSPRRESDEEAARKGTDRYRPSAGGRGSRSRSPLPRRRDGRDVREGGRRPGGRREGAGRRGDRGERGERAPREGARPKKTQEELDAEMDDYFGGGGGGGGSAQQNSAPVGNGAGAIEDVDMIE